MPTNYLPLPGRCRVEADAKVGRALLAGCDSAPAYTDEDLYEVAVQTAIHDAVRGAHPAGFDDLVGEIRNRLAEPPYTLIVRGIPFERDERLFLSVCRALGEMIAPPLQKPRQQLVHRIQPTTDILAAKGPGRESERLHTDCADWLEPCRLLAMTCVRPDPSGGGDSLALDRDQLAAELERRAGAEAVDRLERQPVPWKLAPYLEGDVAWQPVLGDGRLRWRRYTIDAALAVDGVELAPELARLLDQVEETVESTRQTLRFRLEQGDLLIMDNHRAIHGRAALGADPRAADRLMLRSWIRALDA